VIDNGYLYIAQPPLFRVQKGRTAKYVYTESEKEKAIKEMQNQVKGQKSPPKADPPLTEKIKSEIENAEADNEEFAGEETEKAGGISIQRYKGLGEMNPPQLWETTMDPANRLLKKVVIEDAVEADRLFDILMGDEVFPRKKFIQTQAAEVKELDI
jgi:DNA gyrase subunit B